MKKLLVILLTLSIFISFITGCSQSDVSSSTQPPSSTPSSTPSSNDEPDNLLPLVNEPLTLEAAVMFNKFAPWEDNLALHKLQEETGITIEYRIYSESEQVSLMYASREYPDISLGLSSTEAQIEAIEAGDVVCLDDYMELTPNIKAFLEKYPDVKTQVLFNGSLYAYPYVFLDEVSYGIRDIWLINRMWLDELSLQMPETSEDFLNVLRAFRDNAGVGTIPQDVIPYYLRYDRGPIGGIYDVICAFGTYVYDGTYGIVDNGKFVFQATNPDIKEPLMFLAQMYEEKLIPVSMFTDDSATYYSVVNSSPPIAGCVAGYHNGNNYTLGDWFYPMAPFQTSSGKKPYTRTQARGSHNPFAYMIYKDCIDIEAAVKLADYMAIPEVSMEMQWGIEGYAWKYNDEGLPELNPDWVRDIEASGPYNGPDNLGFALLSSDFYVNPSIELEGHRAWAVYNTYADYLPNPTFTYPRLPSGTLDEMDQARLSDLNEDILMHVQTTIGNWISGKGNINEEWDSYVEKLDELGLEEYLELQQKKLDNAFANN
ncbi:TPA: hypothetical protein GXZ34_00365 [bacterium]|nr:hypothetical protein [bacterium]